VLAQLHHPNIVQVIDFNVTPSGVPYIAMELIDGVDLRAELDQGRRFEVTEIVSIVRQVASALDAAHVAGVVHRDLKPENVVLSPWRDSSRSSRSSTSGVALRLVGARDGRLLRFWHARLHGARAGAGPA